MVDNTQEITESHWMKTTHESKKQNLRTSLENHPLKASGASSPSWEKIGNLDLSKEAVGQDSGHNMGTAGCHHG